jgi:hypothetical protein
MMRCTIASLVEGVPQASKFGVMLITYYKAMRFISAKVSMLHSDVHPNKDSLEQSVIRQTLAEFMDQIICVIQLPAAINLSLVLLSERPKNLRRVPGSGATGCLD